MSDEDAPATGRIRLENLIVPQMETNKRTEPRQGNPVQKQHTGEMLHQIWGSQSSVCASLRQLLLLRVTVLWVDNYEWRMCPQLMSNGVS
jgi:hypothetical protein